MHTGRMSRMRTSVASLLWARPAMWRACSSEVRAGSGPFFAASLAPVQAELRDPGGHRLWDEAVDRLATGDALADVAGGDRHRLELEEPDAIGPLEPLEHAVEPLARVAGPRRDGDARELEHAVRVLPVEEVAELVGAEQEERVVPATLAEHVDGALVLVEAELLLRGPRKCDVAVVRRVEGPAEEPGGHASSTTSSSPRSISSPRFAPACFSASSSSSSSGSSPTTRKPRSVR